MCAVPTSWIRITSIAWSPTGFQCMPSTESAATTNGTATSASAIHTTTRGTDASTAGAGASVSVSLTTVACTFERFVERADFRPLVNDGPGGRTCWCSESFS